MGSMTPKPNYSVPMEFVVVGGGFIYRDLGVFHNSFSDGTYIRIHAYIEKKINTSGYHPQYHYEYVLVAVSQSFNGSRIAETWLFDNKILIDGIDVSSKQFPDGMTTYIRTTPTNIYSYFTNSETIGDFNMQWGNSTYENR